MQSATVRRKSNCSNLFCGAESPAQNPIPIPWTPAFESVIKLQPRWINAVRPSRPRCARRLRTRKCVNAINSLPHAEQAAERPCRSTHGASAALAIKFSDSRFRAGDDGATGQRAVRAARRRRRRGICAPARPTRMSEHHALLGRPRIVLVGGRAIAVAPSASRARPFELSIRNCRARFRVLHLQKIYRRIFPPG
jgi:hypothetical protein